MNKLFVIVRLGFLTAIPAAAQAVQKPATNQSSSGLGKTSTGNRNNTVRSAERMPVENYGLCPGWQEKVRTSGQQVGHIANYNYLWCSQAKGEKNPNAGIHLEGKYSLCLSETL